MTPLAASNAFHNPLRPSKMRKRVAINYTVLDKDR